MSSIELFSEALAWVMAIWVTVMGGVIGSFLNVVVYRLPAGKSLISPGSQCPACNHPIRWFDNLPVLGWLILRGRCRDCHATISPRYPIVEAITAAMFLVLYLVESHGGGIPPLTNGNLMIFLPYHLLLLCTLLAAALIEYDGHQAPLKLFLPAIVAGALAPLSWPDDWTDWVANNVAGLAVGSFGGWLIYLLSRDPEKKATFLGPACVGLFLGWQAAVVVSLLTIVLHLLLIRAARLPTRISPTGWLTIFTFGWILGWAELAGRWP